MRQIAKLWIGCIVLVATVASAQSLGDYARSIRKDKGPSKAAGKHYDNDNMPKTEHLSVIGQPAAPAPETAAAKSDEPTPEAKTNIDASGKSTDPATAPKDDTAERQKMFDDWKKRIQDQKDQIATAEKDLDLTNREYRLRAAAMYADVGNRLRNSSAWDKEDRDFKQQISEKEKAVVAQKQKLEDLQNEARKAGVPASVRE
jgi:hypothetical protein